jgi:tetratricopeptide (TPR) repeat protein
MRTRYNRADGPPKNRMSAYVAFLCFSILALGQAHKPAEPTVLERAQKFFDAQDYAQAAPLLREYLATADDDAAAWFNLGFAETALGNKAAAEEAYSKTLAIDPKIFPAQLNLGMLLVTEKRPSDALSHLKAAVELKPTHPRAAALYADALAATGDRAAARLAYDVALALDPAAASTLAASGRLAIDEKDYPLAEQQLARATELSPKDPNARLELARVYELSGHGDRAATVYRAFLKDDPTFAPAHRRLGQILVEQNKLDEAIGEFEEAAKLAPSDEDDWNLARAYSAAKKADFALPRLVKLRKLYPANYEVMLLAGQMLNLKREFATAESILLQAVKAQPKIPDAYVELANALYLQQRYPETVTVLDRMKASVENVKETPWSYFLRAISLDKLGVAEGAIVAYKRFLEIAGGKLPDQEFQARQRVKALTLVLEKKGKKVPQ